MDFVTLVIAAIAGIAALGRGNGASVARRVGGRAMAMALGLSAFPLIPIACDEAHFDYHDDLTSVMAWLSVLSFAGGCVWLTRSARSIRRAPE